MNVIQLYKLKERWKYKEKSIIQDKKKQEQIMKKCHKNKMTRHSNVRKTLQKVKKIAFWNNIIKNIIRYVQECLSC